MRILPLSLERKRRKLGRAIRAPIIDWGPIRRQLFDFYEGCETAGGRDGIRASFRSVEFLSDVLNYST